VQAARKTKGGQPESLDDVLLHGDTLPCWETIEDASAAISASQELPRTCTGRS